MVRSLKRRLAQVAQLEIEVEEDVEFQVEVVEEHHITMLLKMALPDVEFVTRIKGSACVRVCMIAKF